MITRWTGVPSSIDHAFDDVMRNVVGAAGVFGTATNARGFAPHIDVRVTDDAVVFNCDVPGVRREDLDVEVENSTLTIKGTRKFEDGAPNERLALGRGYGSFSRAFTLPDGLDYDALTAQLADGVLRISIPRSAKAKAKKIQIG